MSDQILTTHVGSLVRPPRAMSYVEAIEGGAVVEQQAYDTCLREEIANVIRRQADAGIDIVSDGKFGKRRSMGTDCSFAQTPHVRRVHPSIMWAKLSALAEGARIATRALYR
jgi:methionine synthase II (cobalamin-independent)